MTATFGAIGSKTTTGDVTVAIPYPSGVAAADLAVEGRIGWTAANTSFTSESGWTQQGTHDGGTGFAADSHTTAIAVDSRELDGSESGSVTFDNGASCGGAVGVMLRYTKSAGETWDVVYSEGTDDTHAANRAVTAGTSTALAPGDVVVAFVAVDTDAALTITSPAITASGITFGTTTRRTSATSGSTSGTDGNIEVFEATVSSGSGTAALGLTFTTATSQCGPVAFLRLRAVTSGSTVNATAAATQASSGTAAATVRHPATATGAGGAGTGSAVALVKHPATAGAAGAGAGSAVALVRHTATASGTQAGTGTAVATRIVRATAAGTQAGTGAAAATVSTGVVTVSATAAGVQAGTGTAAARVSHFATAAATQSGAGAVLAVRWTYAVAAGTQEGTGSAVATSTHQNFDRQPVPAGGTTVPLDAAEARVPVDAAEARTPSIAGL